MLDILESIVDRLLQPNLLGNKFRWRSLIINRRKPWTYRVFTDHHIGDENIRICLHRFSVCDPEESFLHPHPWPGAFLILKGQYLMSLGASTDRVSQPTEIAKFVMNAGSKYEIVNPLTWHSVTPLEECYTIMINGEPWDKDYAHTDIRTTKGKDLDSMSEDELIEHLNKFKELLC